MAYFKDNLFQPDGWRIATNAREIGPRVILPVEIWQASPNMTDDLELGLWLEPGTDIDALGADLQRFCVIVINFPKFSDGRGYSMARKIRGYYGFAGELRAAGDILFDQLHLLLRCGFDAFAIENPVTEKLLQRGHGQPQVLFYQPGLSPEIPAGTRPWARRAAP